MNKKRITALIGAGATMDIGGIDSRKLTEEVIEINPLLKKIYSAMNEKNPNINFEDIMNALEILLSMKARDNQSQKPTPWIAFVELNSYFKDESTKDILTAHQELLLTIAKIINVYDKALKFKDENKFFIDFWQSSTEKNPWDIITLNYDTCLEQCLAGKFVDGFSSPEKVMGIYVGAGKKFESPLASRFEPHLLEKVGDYSRIMHLHGAVNFANATPNDDPNKYVFREKSDDDMYKYPSYEQARVNWYKWNAFQNSNQAREIIFNDPIISGLKKPDKLLTVYPYAYYFYEFHRAIISNQSLFIVGYSFGDDYLNNLLLRMAEFHGDSRRVVVVTYWDMEKILAAAKYKVDREDVFMENEFAVYSRLMQEEFAEIFSKARFKMYDWRKRGMLESEDHCVRIYFEGLKSAVIDHNEEILEFLNS